MVGASMRALGPARFLLILGSLALAPAPLMVEAAKAMEIADLQGRWDLISVNAQPLRPGEPIYFAIDGQKISGFDGCNHFGGRLDSPSRLVISQRACEPDVAMLPLNLTDPLPQLKAAKLVDGRLLLPLPDGRGEAQFNRR
jgi:heat shock protein HslJ